MPANFKKGGITLTDYNKKVREEITASLVEAIKAGTAPWTCPWPGREAPKNI